MTPNFLMFKGKLESLLEEDGVVPAVVVVVDAAVVVAHEAFIRENKILDITK